MEWFYTERYLIDPELRELCSQSRGRDANATIDAAKRRYSRSRSRGESQLAMLRQMRPTTAEPQPQQQYAIRKPNNKDSALGSSDVLHILYDTSIHGKYFIVQNNKIILI